MKSLEEITILDILSFYLGVKNLDMNITQTDLQNETKRLDNKVDQRVDDAIARINKHLELQDQKLDYIIKLLEEEKGNERYNT